MTSPQATGGGVKRRAPGDCDKPWVFDIGANCGQSAERYISGGFRVVAVEPNPVAASAIRTRLASAVAAGILSVVEKAVWTEGVESLTLYVNTEDSEWTSVFESCGRRYDTEAKEVTVEATTLANLYESYGQPLYIKVDVEGADDVVLKQLRDLPKPRFLSFELNCLSWLEQAWQLGYRQFKLVAQSQHQAGGDLRDEHGRPLTHAGNFGDEAAGVSAGGGWRTLEQVREDCERLCIVHDSGAPDVSTFASKWPPSFVERDFATLRACFPIESRDAEEWYDVHCKLGC